MKPKDVIDCDISSCPFRIAEQNRCSLPEWQYHRMESTGGSRITNSLVVESLEIGRALADHGRAKFRAGGTCMYPCVQPGDTLHIETHSMEDIRIGSIAVFRRNGRLFGHRVFAKGADDDGPYVVTRPDRSDQSGDGPIREQNILGVVSKIERNGKQVSTTPIALKGLVKTRAMILEWWDVHARQRVINGIERVQRLSVYENIAPLWFKLFRPQIRFEVRTPLKPRQSHDLYRLFPSDEFDVSLPIQQGKPVMEWTLALYLNAAKTSAAWATLIRSPEGCPLGMGWHIANMRTQLRYQGIGLDNAVTGKAGEILARTGMAIRQEA